MPSQECVAPSAPPPLPSPPSSNRRLEKSHHHHTSILAPQPSSQVSRGKTRRRPSLERERWNTKKHGAVRAPSCQKVDHLHPPPPPSNPLENGIVALPLSPKIFQFLMRLPRSIPTLSRTYRPEFKLTATLTARPHPFSSSPPPHLE